MLTKESEKRKYKGGCPGVVSAIFSYRKWSVSTFEKLRTKAPCLQTELGEQVELVKKASAQILMWVKYLGGGQ